MPTMPTMPTMPMVWKPINSRGKAPMNADDKYIAHCKGKAFLASKVGTNHESLASNSKIKQEIESKFGIRIGAGDTRRFLPGLKENTPLGIGQIVISDELALHHDQLESWKEDYWEYGRATKYGHLILAGTLETFEVWAKSEACRKEVAGVPDGRLFAYIQHKEDDEGGSGGYIIAVKAQSNAASATVRNGKGYSLFASGGNYHGELKNGLRHGKGIEKHANGDVYEGDFKDNKKHGKGIFKWSSGTVYEGGFRNDKIDGKGVKKWTNSEMYDGDWKDGNRHGQGKFTDVHGEIYDGEWKNDKQHGHGKIYKLVIVKEGIWQNGTLQNSKVGFKTCRKKY